MGGLLKKLLFFVIGVVALFMVATIAVSLFFDPNDYRDRIAEEVQRETGRDLLIEGDLELSVFPRFGIDVVDVRVKRIEFSEEVSESVYNRMRQERARVASELRAEGAENAERIRAEADRERTVILAEAYRDAEKVRGQGDASAADIYARAFGKDREFYGFYRSIQAYRRSVGTGNDILVLDSDSDFLRYLNQSGQ